LPARDTGAWAALVVFGLTIEFSGGNAFGARRSVGRAGKHHRIGVGLAIARSRRVAGVKVEHG